MFFLPIVVGHEGPDIASIVKNCVSKADINIRKELLNGIVLCGGNAKMKNLKSRLLDELKGKY